MITRHTGLEHFDQKFLRAFAIAGVIDFMRIDFVFIDVERTALPRLPAVSNTNAKNIFGSAISCFRFYIAGLAEIRTITSVQNAAARGKITLISVNSPGWVSTSIEPPCCFTMMS